MKSTFKFLLGVVWVFTITPSLLVAQDTDTEPEIPFIPVQLQRADARSLSMGDALIGDPYTISVIQQNPAVLSLLDYYRAVSVGSWYDARFNRLNHSMSMPLYLSKKHRFATVINLQHSGDRRLSLWDQPSEMDPDFMVFDALVAYSILLTPKWSAGIGQTLSKVENDLESYTTTSTLIGMQYHPDPSLSYGITFRGIGRESTFLMQSDAITELGTASIAQELEIGGSFRYPVDFSPNKMVLSLASTKEFGQSGLLFKGGLELWATPWLALRGGFLVRTRTNEDGPRFGMGLKGSWIWLDYGVAYSNRRNETQHQMTLTLPFCVKCTSY